MTGYDPLRLPEGGRSIACELCQAPVALTLQNPRRVCAACGNVNLPTPELEARVQPPARPARGAFRRRPWRSIDLVRLQLVLSGTLFAVSAGALLTVAPLVPRLVALVTQPQPGLGFFMNWLAVLGLVVILLVACLGLGALAWLVAVLLYSRGRSS